MCIYIYIHLQCIYMFKHSCIFKDQIRTQISSLIKKEDERILLYRDIFWTIESKIRNWQRWCPTELINHNSFRYFDTGKRENKMVYIVPDRRKNLHKASTAKRKQTGQKVSMRRSSIHSGDVVGQKK